MNASVIKFKIKPCRYQILSKIEILNDNSSKIEAGYYLGFAYAAVGDRKSSIATFKQFLDFSTNKADDPVWKEWRAEAKKQIEIQG